MYLNPQGQGKENLLKMFIMNRKEKDIRIEILPSVHLIIALKRAHMWYKESIKNKNII